MESNNFFIVVTFAITLLVSACANKQQLVMAPDTGPGDQLKPEYMVGDWCTNRELTSQANKNAGHSALSNLSPQYWRFIDGGDWQNADSGWLYLDYGNWQLEGLNTMILERQEVKPRRYQANFKNEGKDLYLLDEEDKFLILSRCD